jgi:hypothetical protein
MTQDQIKDLRTVFWFWRVSLTSITENQIEQNKQLLASPSFWDDVSDATAITKENKVHEVLLG